jgi:paraquat-inducible protein B
VRLGCGAGKARADGLGACWLLRPVVALARGGWLVLRCYRWRG